MHQTIQSLEHTDYVLDLKAFLTCFIKKCTTSLEVLFVFFQMLHIFQHATICQLDILFRQPCGLIVLHCVQTLQ